MFILLLLECPNFNCNPVEPPGPVPGGCPRAIDLVFIMDSSGSVQWWNWPKVREKFLFLLKIVKRGEARDALGFLISCFRIITVMEIHTTTLVH